MTAWTLEHRLHDLRSAEPFRSGCGGTFRVVEDDGVRPAVAVCDSCGADLGVRQSALVGVARVVPVAGSAEDTGF